MCGFKSRFFSLIFILFVFCISKNVKSLNLFEFTMVGVGTGFLADQYFDSSLEYSNDYGIKRDIIRKFYQSKKKNTTLYKLRQLPLNQQLLIIEELENY